MVEERLRALSLDAPGKSVQGNMLDHKGNNAERDGSHADNGLSG